MTHGELSDSKRGGRMKKDRDVVATVKWLQQINRNRPMSKLTPRFSIFREALDELVHECEINEDEAIYFAFCYAEQQKNR